MLLQGSVIDRDEMSKCIGCNDQPAGRLECPTCKKLGIPGSFFCTQDCFKKYWSEHKKLHSLMQSLASANSGQDSVNPAGKVSAALGSRLFGTPQLEAASVPASMAGFRWTGSLRPHYPLSPTRTVPEHIQRPDYADHPQGYSLIEARSAKKIRKLNAEEIEGMRKVCRLAREVLDHTASFLKPGITSDELDRICHEACVARDSYPSPLNYMNFPKSVCISVNEVICHGIPDQRPLQEGDIVNLDVTLYHGGFHGDLNATYAVGKVDDESAELIATTKSALEAAIAICKPGVLYREIGNTIESVVKPKGFSIVRQYTGHGIDQRFHSEPNITHYGNSKMPGRMEEGVCFTIEPMINAGVASLDHWRDNWTAVTKDGKRSAQFEEVCLITKDGVEVLTRPGMKFPVEVAAEA